MSFFTVALKNLALTAVKTGVQYALPALNDWVLSKNAVVAALDSGQVVRNVVLQDGTPITITVAIDKVTGLRDAMQRHLDTESESQIYTNQLINIDHDAVTVTHPLGGMFSLAGLINVGW